jgi:hypothetical protein
LNTEKLEDFMKQWILAIWVFLTVSFGFDSCSPFVGNVEGNGHITSQEKTVTEFDGIVLDGIGDINVHFSNVYKVIVVTDSNIQDIITINVINNLLYINEKENKNINAKKLEINVYMPILRVINNNGVGNINVENGNTTNLEISLSGIGDIYAQNYQARDINIINSGIGDAKVWATGTLTGELSGIGNILYKGEPKININTTGIGNIIKI